MANPFRNKAAKLVYKAVINKRIHIDLQRFEASNIIIVELQLDFRDACQDDIIWITACRSSFTKLDCKYLATAVKSFKCWSINAYIYN